MCRMVVYHFCGHFSLSVMATEMIQPMRQKRHNTGRPARIDALAALAGVTVPQFLQSAFEQHGTIYNVAAAVGMSPSTIKYHMRKHGLRLAFHATIQEQAS